LQTSLRTKIRKRFYTKKRELLLVLGQQPNSPSLPLLWRSPTGPSPSPIVIIILQTRSSTVALQRPPDATASPRRPGSKPPTVPGYKKVAAAPRNPSPSSLSLSFLPVLLHVRACELPPWPPSLAAARSRPGLLRDSPQHRLILLLFLAQGIEPRRAESPPIVAVSPQDLRAAAAEFAAVGAPPAEPTLPSTFW
jgi:hypothetical protein